MQYIIFQIIFFCALLFFAFKHNRSSVSKIVLIEWIISSVFTYIYTYYALQAQTSFNFVPVLYWDLCYLLYLFPVLGIEIADISVSDKFIKYSIGILFFLGMLSLLPLSENLVYLIKNYTSQSSSILEMYEDKMDVDNKTNLVTWLSPIGFYIHTFTSKFTYLALLILFIVATKINYIPTLKLSIILCLFANYICFTLNASGRGGVAEIFLVTLVFYFLFRNKIIIEIPRRLKLSVLAAGGGIIACMVVLSLIRTESVSREGEEWIVTSLYLGEGQVNFFEYMWNCTASAQGDYCFSYVKDFFGFDTFTNFLERRIYWNESKTGYDPVRFYTFIGSWFADLRYFTILFVLLSSYLFRKMLIKCNGIFTPLSLYAVYIYLDIFIMGFSVFNFMVYPKFRQMVVNFIYLVLLYILTKNKKA